MGVDYDSLCQRDMAIFDPHRIHSRWPITEQFLIQVMTSATPTAVPDFVKSVHRGLPCKWVKYNPFIIYL